MIVSSTCSCLFNFVIQDLQPSHIPFSFLVLLLAALSSPPLLPSSQHIPNALPRHSMSPCNNRWPHQAAHTYERYPNVNFRQLSYRSIYHTESVISSKRLKPLLSQTHPPLAKRASSLTRSLAQKPYPQKERLIPPHPSSPESGGYKRLMPPTYNAGPYPKEMKKVANKTKQNKTLMQAILSRYIRKDAQKNENENENEKIPKTISQVRAWSSESPIPNSEPRQNKSKRNLPP
jgi:hypothetical protein